MKSVLILLSILTLGLLASAEKTPKDKDQTVKIKTTDVATTATPAAKKKASQTDMNFEELLVNGQYHFNEEAVTTVEEDKVLNSMIGVRTDFKDRMRQSSTLGEVKTK